MKVKAHKIPAALPYAMHLYHSISLIANIIFGIEKGTEVLKAGRPESSRLLMIMILSICW